MSTRCLFRSAVEPGKHRYAGLEKNRLDRSLRQQERRFIQNTLRHPDADFAAPRLERYGAKRGQDDNLNPLTRYLASRVGRLFSVVLSELHSRGDQRRMRVWHLLGYFGPEEHGHLWDRVHYCPDIEHCIESRYLHDEGWFHVDAEGVLRGGTERVARRRGLAPWSPSTADRRRYTAMLVRARVQEHEGALWWFEPVCCARWGYHQSAAGHEPEFRATRLLTRADQWMYYRDR